jgi:hypothetical protein
MGLNGGKNILESYITAFGEIDDINDGKESNILFQSLEELRKAKPEWRWKPFAERFPNIKLPAIINNTN